MTLLLTGAGSTGAGGDPHPAAAGSTFVNDTFTGSDAVTLASHTGETGATWTSHATGGGVAYQIQTNRVRATTNGVGFYHASGVPSTAEYDVLGDLYFASAVVDSSAVAARINTAADTAYFGGYQSTTTKWILWKRVAGATTVIASSNVVSLTPGQTYSLRLAIRDAWKGLYVDSVLVVEDIADNTITAKGVAGFRGSVGTAGAAVGIQYARLWAINV